MQSQQSFSRLSMKRLILAATAVTILLLGFATSPASAHVLKTDGTISGVLHTNPDDAPVSGSATSYIIYFSDTANRFTLPACNCTVAVQENGKTIYTHSLATTNSLRSDDAYTFQKPDVYSLQIRGQPKVSGAFQPFALNYLVRVEAGSKASNTQSFPKLVWIGMGLMIGLILLAAYKSGRRVE